MVRFGVQLWTEEFAYNNLKKACLEADDMGYDSLWLYDHFYPVYPLSGEPRKEMLETWTVLPCLADATTRLRLGVLVTCNSYRYPAVLAKMATTLDVISNGRLEFGLGAGWYKAEYDGYGIPFPNPKTRIEQLAESIEIITRAWTQDKVNFDGKHYTIKDLVSYPKPVQKPHPPIWLGGKGSRLLEVTARYANYVNFVYCSPKEYQDRLNVLKKRCRKVGRDYDEIEKTWHGIVILAEKEADLKRQILRSRESATEKVRTMGLENYLNRVVAGTPEQCLEKLQKYADLGVTYFIPHFSFAQDLKALRVFIDKVAPELQ